MIPKNIIIIIYYWFHIVLVCILTQVKTEKSINIKIGIIPIKGTNDYYMDGIVYQKSLVGWLAVWLAGLANTTVVHPHVRLVV